MDFERLAVSVGKGAAVGSAIPVVGTALGAVGGAVIDLAPEIGRWVFGSNSGQAVEAVKVAIQAATGTVDPEAQLAVLAGSPDKAYNLRLELSRIAAAQASVAAEAAQAELVAHLQDVAHARAASAGLVQAGSVMAWGAPIVSLIVLVTFGMVVTFALTKNTPTEADPVLNMLLGTLGAMATSVVGYWVGSSVGSARKDARLATLADR